MMDISHIPEKIRYDAAAAVFTKGNRLFNKGVSYPLLNLKDANKVRNALHYFEISDSIYTEVTCLNHIGLCHRMLGQWKECLVAYENLLAEAIRLGEYGVGSKELAEETIQLCKEMIAQGEGPVPGEEGSDAIEDQGFEQLAAKFGEALTSEDYQEAHAMLSAKLKKRYSAAKLETELQSMIEYAGEPVEASHLVDSMTDWSGKKTDDIGWAYVSLEGEGFSEAVILVVALENERLVISEIEWGRP